MHMKSETAKRRNGETARTRSAFTLVEMIVVITIMLILTVLAVAVVPKFQDNDNIVRGADLISQAFLTAKMRALREQVPTGVRLQPLTTTFTNSTTPVPPPTAPNQVTQVTPLAMSGLTANALTWNIVPGSTLIIDPGSPITEVVTVLSTTATTFSASFQNGHQSGFLIHVLAYSQELQYIQQPDDFIVTPGVNVPPASSTPYPVRRISPGVWQWNGASYQWAPNLAMLEDPQAGVPLPWPDFSGGLANPLLWPVQPGDYLEAKGNGVVHYIQSVAPAPSPPYPPGQYSLLSLGLPGGPVSGFVQPGNPPTPPGGTPPPYLPASLTTQYRIIRAPRVLEGETPLELSQKVVVDLNPKIQPLPGQPPTIDPITLLPIDPMTGNIDIMFSPSGGLIGRKRAISDKLVLWVRDGTKDVSYPVPPPWPPGGSPGDQYLVTIQVRTGFIAVHPVNISTQDPYAYARDDRSSGL